MDFCEIEKMKKTLYLFLMVLAALVTLPSCSSDDYWDDGYYYSPLVGNWQLSTVNGFPVDEVDVTEFCFYSDGRGTYGQYSNFPQWSTYQLTWNCEFPTPTTNMLYVQMWDGQLWTYRFSVGYGQLTLWDTLNGNVLVYLPY